MESKLFVGSLAFSVTDQELEELFAQFGTVVSAKVITDRDTGRSKGFGFVEMSTPEEASQAIAGLHEKEVGGRQLTVNIAKPMTPRPSNGHPSRRY
jgi:RNA recognition motif-containing protein